MAILNDFVKILRKKNYYFRRYYTYKISNYDKPWAHRHHISFSIAHCHNLLNNMSKNVKLIPLFLELNILSN